MNELHPGYLLAHPSSLGIAFAYPAALLMLALVPVLGRLGQAERRRVLALRIATYALIVLLLAELRLTARLPEQRLTLVAVVDESLSISEGGRRYAMKLVNEVARFLAPGDEMGVVKFATNAAVTDPLGPARRFGSTAPLAPRNSTNLQRALETAVALLPEEGARGILLISDGNETRGDLRAMLPDLARQRIRVDVAVPPLEPQTDVAIEKLVVEPLVGEGELFPLRVTARSDVAGRGRLKLFLDGMLVESSSVDLARGTSSYEVAYRLTGRGVHTLRVELECAEDRRDGNNSREATITVTTPPQILLVAPSARSLVADVLARKGEQVHVIQPRDFPQTLRELLAYQAVFLDGLTSAHLPASSYALLDRYVGELGGGLIFAGGDRSFGDPGFHASLLPRMLPVTMEPHTPNPKGRDPIALFVLIDRSNSMGYNSRIPTLHDGEKLRYAKEAALAVIRPLKDQDLVGVIAFDSQQYPIAPLRPLKNNRALLERDIPRLVENGGTDFFEALQSASQQLAASRVARRHVILLTDGDTNRAANEHDPLIEAIAEHDISVTTIRIGQSEGVHLLQDIAERTGGRFYHVDDATMLPDLMLRDTTRAVAPPSAGGDQFLPKIGTAVEALGGIDASSIPPLRGYAYARARRGADVALHIRRLDQEDPLLAVWHYGLGRVAAFTASVTDDAESWPAWDAFSKFWSQLVRWTMSEHAAWDYAVDVRKIDGQVILGVQTFSPLSDGWSFVARLQSPTGTASEIPLAATAPRRFSALLPALEKVRPSATLIASDRSGGISERTFEIQIPESDEADAQELQRREPNLALLHQLAEATGGKLNPTAREISQRTLGTATVEYRLDRLLAPLALVAFLADVALRRLRWLAM